VFSESDVYAPLAAFSSYETDQSIIFADVKENQIRPVRRALLDVPGTIVLETRIINDLINSIINQFTSLPVLVAILALATGGIVIMNSVALSTLERRREIGIMKAVGLQRERVLGMLLLENGLMGIVGGLIGVGISFIAIVLVLTTLPLEQLQAVDSLHNGVSVHGRLHPDFARRGDCHRVGRVGRKAAQRAAL